MNKETLKALKGSIKKWEEIVAGTEKDRGVDNCPLCSLFWAGKRHCQSCPVLFETGGRLCWESPYSEWLGHQVEWHHIPSAKNEYEIICSTCRRLAKAELTFLRSLLPQAKK